MRPFGSKNLVPSELSEHLALASWLRAKVPDAWWFHPPNGEKRSSSTAAKLRAMGVSAGVPDIVMLEPKRIVIELKRLGVSKPSKEQAAWLEVFERNGFIVGTCSGWRAAVEFLQRHGVGV